MNDPILSFYDSLAPWYHLIFEDWEKSIQRQSEALNRLLISELGPDPLRILDCACGIGTQTIGLAGLGHGVVGSDLSRQAIERARRETAARNLGVQLYVSSMTDLSAIPDSGFDAVAALDNALPHLSSVEVEQAVRAMRRKLRPGGLLLASIRDYDALVRERPAVQGPAFYGANENRRMVHQVWDWTSEDRYIVHLYLTVRTDDGWASHHFVSEYRCLLRSEFTAALQCAGFENIRWLTPRETGFYQPIVAASVPG